PCMKEILETVKKVNAVGASTILLLGENGTGKDMLARGIHSTSERAGRPFQNITCTALPDTLIESELFGHERGAFTDAKVQKKGLLELADGGTAFLDEIGDMSPSMQARLLRFLEDHTFKRVGGTRDIHVDVRVIAATNRRLSEAVKEKTFREDLYYRLRVIPILLPPLRHRTEDIPLLVQHFLDRFNQEFHKNTRGVTREAMARLMAHPWHGNIRELRNVIERIMILENKDQIDVPDLPGELAALHPDRTGSSPAASGPLQFPLGRMTLEQMEEMAIRQALIRTGQNQVRAARLLGISRDTLRYRLKKLNLGHEDGAAAPGSGPPGEIGWLPED
ncbi:MAG: sigma-54 interaction domain-containing protein, partial [Acidobacteriota bacterium]